MESDSQSWASVLPFISQVNTDNLIIPRALVFLTIKKNENIYQYLHQNVDVRI